MKQTLAVLSMIIRWDTYLYLFVISVSSFLVSFSTVLDNQNYAFTSIKTHVVD